MSYLFLFISALLVFSGLMVFLATLICKPADIRYAFMNLFRQRRRTAITLSAITSGGVAVLLFGGFVNHTFWALQEQSIHTNRGHIQIFQKGYLASNTTNPLQFTIKNYEEIKGLLLSDKNINGSIKTITGQLSFNGIASHYESGVSTYFSGIGIEPESALSLGSLDSIISGSDLSRVKRRDITIGVGVARTLAAGYGDWVDLLVINAEGGQDALSSQVRGVFQAGIKEYDDTALKMPLSTAQEILQTRDVSKIIILLKETKKTAAVQQKIDEIIATHDLPLETRSWDKLDLLHSNVVNLFQGIFFFIKFIVSVIIVFMAGNTLMMNVMERTREIATLRALGLTRFSVARLFIIEGFILGALGAALSIAVGLAIASLINIKGIPMPPSPSSTEGYIAFIKWRDDAALLWFVATLPVVTALLASFFPARRASRLVIAEAFRFV